MKKRVPTEQEIAKKHGVDVDYVIRQAEIGSTVEREHVTDHTAANTVSGGIEILCGYFTNSTSVDTKTSLNFLNMGSDLTYSSPDLIVLAVTELLGGSGNGKIIGLTNIIENL
jgi:hypothetical protein